MTATYEKLMKKYNGIEFVRENNHVIGCKNDKELVQCHACDFPGCPMRHVH